MNELLSAWAQWFHGVQIPMLDLWGHKVFWWGRIGKLLQLFAALLVLLEIIGADKLKEMAASARKNSSNMVGDKNVIKALFDDSATNSTYVIGIVVAIAVIVVICIYGAVMDKPASAETVEHTVLFWIGFWVLFVIAAVIGTIIFFAVLYGLTALVTYLVSYVLTAIAWVLNKSAVDRFGKTIALILFLIGFHFDFLSS